MDKILIIEDDVQIASLEKDFLEMKKISIEKNYKYFLMKLINNRLK